MAKPSEDGRIYIYYYGKESEKSVQFNSSVEERQVEGSTFYFTFDKNENINEISRIAQHLTGDRRNRIESGAYYYQGKILRFIRNTPISIETEIWIYLNSDKTVSHIAQRGTCKGSSQEEVENLLKLLEQELINRTGNGPTKYNEDIFQWENNRETFEYQLGNVEQRGTFENGDACYVGVINWCEFIK